MTKVLVNIVSDQTIQNVQFIREFADIKNYLFVSTEKMKDKLEWIKKTLQLSNDTNEVIVSEFDTENIKTELYKLLNLQDEYYVNITGGTKIMSLSVYEVFKQLPNSTIYYMTGRNNDYLILHPENKKNKLQYQLGLLEYISSYGITLKDAGQNIHHLIEKPTNTKLFYDFFVSMPEKPQSLSCLRKILQENTLPEIYRFDGDKKKIDCTKVPDLQLLLSNLHYTEPYITTEYGAYLTGLWLEEYAYNKIKEILQLTDNQIGKGLKLQKKDVMNKGDNDFDVMFIWKNELYIIECKTSHFVPTSEKMLDKKGKEVLDENGKPKNKSKNDLTTYIYKLDALRKEFGIFPKAFIFTLSDLGVNSEQLNLIEERLNFHNITLLTHQPKTLAKNQEQFDEWLNNLTK
jgi:hypothetical protein